ncbi:phosphoribosylaminoimidazole-succinocarboxamidesynthase [Striga asiatica]|uniref:Phosphoribosylaminoimidazole-succinocarboxamidesynthase n=1 Tax=Striga asiatica TaxID=4170 RepID=A0A5A7QNG1_STRAF|nr:phosphoribosylaminoimidazole-succinocarboxamidesynthase [Striga asiatica]
MCEKKRSDIIKSSFVVNQYGEWLRASHGWGTGRFNKGKDGMEGVIDVNDESGSHKENVSSPQREGISQGSLEVSDEKEGLGKKVAEAVSVGERGVVVSNSKMECEGGEDRGKKVVALGVWVEVDLRVGKVTR